MCLSEGKQECHSDNVTGTRTHAELLFLFSFLIQSASSFYLLECTNCTLSFAYQNLVLNGMVAQIAVENLWLVSTESICAVAVCALALLWGSVDRSSSTASSQHSPGSAFSWSFSSQILALGSWPLNVGKEKLALLCPCGFAVQKQWCLQDACNSPQVLQGTWTFSITCHTTISDKPWVVTLQCHLQCILKCGNPVLVKS